MIFSQARAAIMMYGAAKPWAKSSTKLFYKHKQDSQYAAE